MPGVQALALPPQALLGRYAHNGSYADCYVLDLPMQVSHAAFVAAFYTTPVFKLERWLLQVLARRPAGDADAVLLAQGSRDAFSAWTVEARAPGQLLLRDMAGRTRSWLMTTPSPAAGGTRLFFGSAVVPRVDRTTGRARMGTAFHLLLGFHRLYSRVLLASAARALARQGAAPPTSTPA